MKHGLAIILLLIISGRLQATIQTPDLLIIEKDTIELREMDLFPLEILNLEYRPFNYIRATAPSTACWRGYQAIWRIVENKIYLERIQRCNGDANGNQPEDIMELLAKNRVAVAVENGMVAAHWINLDLYELKRFYSGGKKVLTDHRFVGKEVANPRYVLRIKNGSITTNHLQVAGM